MNNTSDNQPRWSDYEYRNIALAATVQCAALVDSLAKQGSADPACIRACVEPLLVLSPDSADDVYPNPARFSQGFGITQQILAGKTRDHAAVVRYVLSMMHLRDKLSSDPRRQEQIREGIIRIRGTLTQAMTGAMKGDLDRIMEGVMHSSERASGHGAGNSSTKTLKGALSEADFPAPDPDDPNAAPSRTLGDDRDPLIQEAYYTELARLYQNTISTLAFRIQVQGNAAHLRDTQVSDSVRALLFAGVRSAMLWHQLGGRRWQLLLHRKRIRENLSRIRRNLVTLT